MVHPLGCLAARKKLLINQSKNKKQYGTAKHSKKPNNKEKLLTMLPIIIRMIKLITHNRVMENNIVSQKLNFFFFCFCFNIQLRIKTNNFILLYNGKKY